MSASFTPAAQAAPLLPSASPAVTSEPLYPAVIPSRTGASVAGHTTDRAWTTTGDATGFHVLVADAAAGYRWKTAATLSEPGFDTDAWVGNACVTESGRRAVVAYAPRAFTNKPELMARGAFTAVVDLTTGHVTKLPVQASLSYFSPGCGEGEQAVLSQYTDDSAGENATRLVAVDAAAGTASQPLTLEGQVTSAVPYGGGEFVAADGARLVRIDAKGKRRAIAATGRVPFQIIKDATGGITFLDRPGRQAKGATPVGEVRYVDAAAIRAAGNGRAARPRLVASGELSALDVRGTAAGEVFVTGKAANKGRLPAHVHNPGGLTKDAVMTTRGQAAVSTRWAPGEDTPVRPDQATSERTVITRIEVPATGKAVELRATPGEDAVAERRLGEGRALSPALRTATGTSGAGTSNARTTNPRTAAAAATILVASPTDPVEAERTCSVPRGDVRKQAFQPTPRQVEWAVDQAVINNLNAGATRAPNWKGTGMSGYSPQSLFPLRVLRGDPNGTVDKADGWHIPAQILLGITAQESNLWQATRFAVPGVTANALIGNYYGVEYAPSGEQFDPWAINWAKADCGYGVTQITDGMRLPGHDQPTLPPAHQEAAALDYAANIAAGADKLAEKWNQIRDAGMIMNNGHPRHPENWYFALWAYNSGFYPEADAANHNGQWGVGWTNNPANPLWKANRTPFLENGGGVTDYSHASHPQDWPYQEKVLGWAARPPSAMYKPGVMGAGYRPAWWNTDAFRTKGLKAPEALFCNASNACDPSKIGPDDKNLPGLGACTREDLHCWWHTSARYQDCDVSECGTAVHRFDTTYPEQPDENSSYPPRCPGDPGGSVGAVLPAGALIVDDVPNGVRPAGSAARSCGPVSSAGTFGFEFQDWGGERPGKMDLHQIGGGYGGHFWFSHTRSTVNADATRLRTTGTWTLTQPLGGSGWARVMVHMPDHGAHTRQAAYTVLNTDSNSPVRVLPQRTRANRWVDLGVFRFTGTPKVSLTTVTDDGNGSEDVAWDAVAFQPLAAKPADFVVAMGDSFSSGEGASAAGGADYEPETNYRDPNNAATRNACHRSRHAWSRQATLPGRRSSIVALEEARDPSLDYHLIACSGARAFNILDRSQGGRPQYGELPQIEKGYLDQHTTLVTLSIGGNDALFTPVFQECIMFSLSCYDSDIDVDADNDGTKENSGPLRTFLPDHIHLRVRPQIVRTLEAINAKAPNARIVLMGYPPLLENNGDCIPGISDAEASWLNQIGDIMLQEMDAAAREAIAKNIHVDFANPKAAFAGKGICGDPETVHGIVTDLVESDDPALEGGPLQIGPSAQGFHPKISGARLYADVLQSTLGS
jgi:hypothetical protein